MKTPREGWRPIAAAFAVFALLFHALMPISAAAAAGAGAPTVICTLHGAQTLPGQAPAKGALAACQECCVAASAVDLAPPPLLGPAPTAYERLRRRPAPTVRLALARAPPRPPGQGPPTA